MRETASLLWRIAGLVIFSVVSVCIEWRGWMFFCAVVPIPLDHYNKEDSFFRVICTGNFLVWMVLPFFFFVILFSTALIFAQSLKWGRRVGSIVLGISWIYYPFNFYIITYRLFGEVGSSFYEFSEYYSSIFYFIFQLILLTCASAYIYLLFYLEALETKQSHQPPVLEPVHG